MRRELFPFSQFHYHFPFLEMRRELFPHHPFHYHFLFYQNIIIITIGKIIFHFNRNIILFIIIVIKKIIFFASCFFMSSLALSWLAKMEFTNLTPISARSVTALNSSVESLSEDSTSVVKFLYNYVRKFFAMVSFPAKNSNSTARKGEETRPFDFVQKKNFAKSSFRFTFFPIIPGRVSPSGTKRWPSV